MRGKVYLVGAGPGDPELLTLKALRLLKAADAVLHDDLVSPEILKLISPFAQLFNVGKRCGTKKISQEEIHFLMIALADTGATVVRLKGGDSLIFGRAGEEMEALREADIEYEVVPGVTAALAAASAAQVSLTHRRISSSLTFLTGHSTLGADPIDLKRVVRGHATLVIYMPGDYREISARLLHAGLSSETPCALVSNASSRGQKVVRTTVSELHTAPRLAAPTILIVGEVVRLPKAPDAEVGLAQSDLNVLMAHSATVSDAQVSRQQEER